MKRMTDKTTITGMVCMTAVTITFILGNIALKSNKIAERQIMLQEKQIQDTQIQHLEDKDGHDSQVK